MWRLYGPNFKSHHWDSCGQPKGTVHPTFAQRHGYRINIPVVAFAFTKGLMTDEPARIRDNRIKGWHWIDNTVLDLYAAKLKPVVISVYALLCRHADNHKQTCYPSYSTIAETLGIDRKTAIRSIQLLSRVKPPLIKISRRRDPGKDNRANLYTLLTLEKDITPEKIVVPQESVEYEITTCTACGHKTRRKKKGENSGTIPPFSIENEGEKGGMSPPQKVECRHQKGGMSPPGGGPIPPPYIEQDKRNKTYEQDSARQDAHFSSSKEISVGSSAPVDNLLGAATSDAGGARTRGEEPHEGSRDPVAVGPGTRDLGARTPDDATREPAGHGTRAVDIRTPDDANRDPKTDEPREWTKADLQVELAGMYQREYHAGNCGLAKRPPKGREHETVEYYVDALWSEAEPDDIVLAYGYYLRLKEDWLDKGKPPHSLYHFHKGLNGYIAAAVAEKSHSKKKADYNVVSYHRHRLERDDALNGTDDVTWDDLDE